MWTGDIQVELFLLLIPKSSEINSTTVGVCVSGGSVSVCVRKGARLKAI